MAFSWIRGKTYRVECPDGTAKTLYRNVDDAFPLYIKGWQGDLAAEASGLAEVAADLRAAYSTKIQGLLFGLDELTQTLMINFRSVYIVFVSDPCANTGFLLREVEKLVAEQQRIAKLRIQVRMLLELAKNEPKETTAILGLFQEIAGGMGGRPLPQAAQIEIEDSRQLAEKWAGEK